MKWLDKSQPTCPLTNFKMNTKPVEIVYEMRFALFSILIRFHFVLSPLHLASSVEFAICRD